MHSFFIDGPTEGVLSKEESAHAARVLRLRDGEAVHLIDGRGHAFMGTLTKVDAAATEYAIIGEADSKEPAVSVTLYQGLPKADKLEWIVQKCTEIGACRIVPVMMRYCVAKPKDGKDERLIRIAREAVKQCGRAACPVIEKPMSFKEAVKDMASLDMPVMPWETQRGTTLKSVLLSREGIKSVGIMIGPEGGISEEEAAFAMENGIAAVSLGDRILRTETAAIASVSLAVALLSDQ